MTNCSLHTANVSALGGAIYADSVSLHSSIVTANSAESETAAVIGGGIFSWNGLDIENSTVSDNMALAAPSSFSQAGGASSAGGAVEIIGSTLSGNRATYSAGLNVSAGTSVEIIDSTISGNAAAADIGGAALYAPTTISNSTIAFNTSGVAFGVSGILAGGTLTAQSSIFANNTAATGDEIDVYIVSGAIDGEKNLIVSASGQTPPDTKTACPRLGPLAEEASEGAVKDAGAVSGADDHPIRLFRVRLLGRAFDGDDAIGLLEQLLVLHAGDRANEARFFCPRQQQGDRRSESLAA